MMAENLQKRPKKSILKNSSSFDKPTTVQRSKNNKETKWDEMNIIATYHPPDKDYGHMKVDEPKTPYNYDIADQDGVDGVDASDLAEKIRIASSKPPKVFEPQSEDSDSDSDEENMTEEAKQKRRAFMDKRKKHYNEFQAIQLAKQLMAEEDEEDDDDTPDANGDGDEERNERTVQEYQQTDSEAMLVGRTYQTHVAVYQQTERVEFQDVNAILQNKIEKNQQTESVEKLVGCGNLKDKMCVLL